MSLKQAVTWSGERVEAMMRKLLQIIAIGVVVLSHAHADGLRLPPNLTASSSSQGEALLLAAQSREAYLKLSSQFLTQKTQTFCGVASMVMVFNALNLPAPESMEYAPYRIFTQDNLFNAKTEAILPRDTILKQGMTLNQMGSLAALQPVQVDVRHAAESSLDQFRKEASSYLAQEGHFVVINYLRDGLGQQAGGHFSPLAAYEAKTDRFLILDVARYKYPPVWVTASELFAAMNTPDSDNENKTRGYVLIARKKD